jgi:hypothetical protein
MRLLLILAALSAMASSAFAQLDIVREEVDCCDLTGVTRQVSYVDADSLISFDELASYCGPILWFSPDEPLLSHVRTDARDVNIPMAFPFQEQVEGPVVYYRVRRAISRDRNKVGVLDRESVGESLINLNYITAIELDYFFYYPSEEGFGGHLHDVESIEMSIVVVRQSQCVDCRFALVIHTVTAKAHGVLWYDNTLTADSATEFPMTILVEEGKHASCTDKNGDGYFTPGYDVTERVNDAWGVRDVMRTGALYTGGYQAWLTKVRNPRDRVFPPLPPDSPLLEEFLIEGEYMPDHNKYEVRPFPSVEEAMAGGDESIRRFVEKGYEDWPYVDDDVGLDQVADFLDGEEFIKSVSVAARFDKDVGVSVVFPALIFRHINDPVSGGWILNRIYLKDHHLRDIAWQLMYTPSASRWIDEYFAIGAEWDDDGLETKTWFATEAGLKLRFNLGHTPLGFLSRLTDFWGLRAGIRYRGFGSFSDFGYVIEVGGGTF